MKTDPVRNCSARYFLLLTWCVLILSFSTGLTSCNEDEQLVALMDEAWDYQRTPRPLDPDSGPADDSFDDLSAESIEARKKFWNSMNDKLYEIQPFALSHEERIDFLTMLHYVQDRVDYYDYAMYCVPLNAEGGFFTRIASECRRTQLRDPKAAQKYLDKLNSVPGYMDQQIALMQEGVSRGLVPPCVIIDGFADDIAAYANSDADNDYFLAPINSYQGEIDETIDKLLEECRNAVTESVYPAYRKLEKFMREEYIPACRDDIGISSVPRGKEFYEGRTRHFTTLSMTSDEVFDRGKAEVARIRSRMEDVIDSLGFEGSFEEFLDFLRTDPQFYATTPEELLKAASFHSKHIDGKLPAYFGKLPRLPYGVEPVPDDIAPRYTGGRYVPGSVEDHRSGTYWVNTYNLPSRPLYILPSLTLHEAVPGHHLQISLAAEIEDMHPLRRNYYISAFGEGWALYTEWLGYEMGIYRNLYEEFGALTYEMWRACRLVVDPGMHVKGWSRDEAVEFMRSNTALSYHEINTEINRYIGWPGQAVSYKIGELTIRDLRSEAEETLGPAFDIRDFHDRILENGSMPLDFLQLHVRRWISEVEEEQID